MKTYNHILCIEMQLQAKICFINNVHPAVYILRHI
jgi:hypothetical protein